MNKQAKKTSGGKMMRTEQMLPEQKVDLRGLQYDIGKYAFAAEFVKDKAVLDIACGCGYGSSFLSDKGARIVVGGDISAEAVDAGRRSFGRQGLDFFLLNVTMLPFADNSLDVVISMETIEHLERPEELLTECKRVLKEGGVFICSTPCMNYPTITGAYHVHEFTQDEFRNILPRFFNSAQFYGQERKSRKEAERERTRWEIERRVLKPLKAHTPKIFNIIRRFYHLYIKIVSLFRSHRIQLNQIEDWDKISGEEHKPYPLGDSSITPKTIVAVARK